MTANRTWRYFSNYVDKLPQISAKEKDVLLSRLRKVTLSQIGKKYHVTEGRIRQIEKLAIAKIMHRVYQQKLFKDN